MTRSAAVVLDHHDISRERGFLPERDPLPSFESDAHESPVGAALEAFDRLGAELPARLDEGTVRPAVDSLPELSADAVASLSDREAIRLCTLSGFFASAYVHQVDAASADRLPESVAVPLVETSRRFGRKPILSYDQLCLHNWRRHEPDAALTEPTNLEALVQFTEHDDERWFVVIHVAIEARAGQALWAGANAQEAVRADDPDALVGELETLADSIDAQTEIMRRMTERNDPEVFAREYRPYYEGFDDVVYEGVDGFDGETRTYRGGSGAQSSILPSLDAALGVDHATTELVEKLTDMRSYMPESHREVIDAFDRGPAIGEYVDRADRDDLREAYNDCTDSLATFRRVHFGQVIQYIRAVTGDTTGTGGTDYMEFLQVMQEETAAQTR
ncbi:Indoleamine 2,3-dioxygenase [Halovivax ruber XH-70]|uniref:Indoleamine 2,3-dioxygenase n=1 Tax=Halovivax ruber (strain DSM 18193 / JCM 13892 / XH-70) TaxID=797302 RepID=L0IC08_HALRX|nr:indoleamine 2,3-dioxygenase [Halovivax ruber]AGB17110.1 Indoleamine 2,3-dioxygenase [Halovivax ruber XH-70]